MSALQNPPPTRMGLFEALRYCRAGWSIRRAPWHGGITESTPVPTTAQVAAAHPLAWIRHEFGLFHYRAANGSSGLPIPVPHVTADASANEHVVQNTEVDSTDMRTLDWTTLAPQEANDDSQNPNGGSAPSGDGSGAGGGASGTGGSGTASPNTGGSASGGSGGSSGGSVPGSGSGGGSAGSGNGEGAGGGGGSGGGSGVGSGGGRPRPPRPPRPLRQAPNLTCEVNRTSGNACVPLLSDGGGGYFPNPANITDSFSVNVKLDHDPAARAGELWFLTIKHGTPRGFVVDFNGTIKPGDDTGTTFHITAQPGQSFGVQANAHLPHVNLNASAGGNAAMRSHCGPPGGGGGRGRGSGSGRGGGGGGGRSGGSYVPPP